VKQKNIIVFLRVLCKNFVSASHKTLFSIPWNRFSASISLCAASCSSIISGVSNMGFLPSGFCYECHEYTEDWILIFWKSRALGRCYYLCVCRHHCI